MLNLKKLFTACCVFQPAFGCLQHPKASCTTFFQPFSTFFVTLSNKTNYYWDNRTNREINNLYDTDNFQIWQKVWPSVKYYLDLMFFSTIFFQKNNKYKIFLLNKVWNEQKRLKTTEKSSLTSFCVRAVPKSWSKYTTSESTKARFLMHVVVKVNCLGIKMFRK